MIHSSSADTGNFCEDLNSRLGPDSALMRYADPAPGFCLKGSSRPPLRANRHNPLVAAASRLLSTVARLKPHRDPAALKRLRARLGKRVSRFAHDAISAGVEHAKVKAASYLLCSVADEAVLTCDWGRNSDWATDGLLQAFHDDSLGGEKFFVLLEHFLSTPARHIHLLELIHLCLKLGFEGRYAASAEKRKALNDLNQDLYRCIRSVRDDASRHTSPVQHTSACLPLRPVIRLPAGLLLSATLLSLGIIYAGFAWNLAQQREAALVLFWSPETPGYLSSAEVRP